MFDGENMEADHSALVLDACIRMGNGLARTV